MKKITYTKRMLALALSVITILGLVPMTAFADGTYTFPSLSQSGDNNSMLRYYHTDENAMPAMESNIRSPQIIRHIQIWQPIKRLSHTEITQPSHILLMINMS